MTSALEKECPVASTSSKTAPECPKTSQSDLRRRRKVPRAINEREKANQIGTDLTHKGTRSPNWSLQQWTVLSIWPNPFGIHSQGEEKDQQDFSMLMIQEIQFVNTSINVESGKLDAKVTRKSSDIHYLKNNDRASAELHKSTVDRLVIIFNTCDRIESKCQAQHDEMEEISTRAINE
ncbi:hypothetical protein O181_066231 [Austropuccinia psidii MF-1]|uniref:Uncharacterized protein n=1 Tax=Austropuccinia psidii MF-1 TaxID=1389203 RepID=A0A9Q3EQI7_9BASI|nr:hypothetical protein [Austropuccinia psidii MF-1]